LQAQTGDSAAEAIWGAASAGRALAIGLPPEPPAGAGLRASPVRLAFLRNGQPLAVDVRPRVIGKQEWEFVVEQVNPPFVVRHPEREVKDRAVPRGTGRQATGGTEEVILTWPNLRSVPAEISLTLVDSVAGERRSLRTTIHYTYRPAKGETARSFQIIAEPGRAGSLQVLNLRAEPTRGGGVQVQFLLNHSAETTVEVRTLNGREVATLERGTTRSAGENVVSWNGRDGQGRPLPPGVYLLEVQAVDEEGQAVQAVRTVTLR
jgi:hypothetical protein